MKMAAEQAHQQLLKKQLWEAAEKGLCTEGFLAEMSRLGVDINSADRVRIPALTDSPLLRALL